MAGGKRKKRGEMTPEELAAIRRHELEGALRRHRGEGGMVPNDKVRARLAFLIDEKGIPARTIAKRAGVTEAMVLGHYHGYRRTGGHNHGKMYGDPLHQCTWGFEQKILKARFYPSDIFLVPSCGVHRRVGALICAGYSYSFLAQQLGTTLAVFHRKLVTDARGKIRKTYHDEIAAMYDKLIKIDPLEAGVTEHGNRYSKRLAEKHGYAPEHCWDPDTIDDPDAVPEWTGHCGTETGYFLHLKHNILVQVYGEGTRTPSGKQRRKVLCAPCREARSKGVMQYSRFAEHKDEILEALKDGTRTVRSIADEYGCSSRTIERFKAEARSASEADSS